jgi:hypothetical protein
MTDHKEVDAFAKFVSDLRDDVDKLLKSGGKSVLSGTADISDGMNFISFGKDFSSEPTVVISAAGYLFEPSHPDTNYKPSPINVALGRVTNSGFHFSIIGPLAVSIGWGPYNKLHWMASES